MRKSKSKLIVAAIASLVAELVAPSLTGVAHAVAPQFVQAFVRPDTHKADTDTGVLICATPSAVTSSMTERFVVITFPTDSAAPNDFTVNATASHWKLDTTDIPSGATAWPGVVSGTTSAATGSGGVSGHTVTFDLGGGGANTAGDLSASTEYCFHITGGVGTAGTRTLTNGSAASATQMTGSTLYTMDNAGTPVTVNQTNWATSVVLDNTLTISAIVPPNFTLTMPTNVDTFNTLTTTAINSTTGVTVQFQTNAVGGWIAWVKDQYQGLHSTIAAYTIDSGLKDLTLTQTKFVNDPAFDLPAGGGQEGYVLDVDLTTPGVPGCTNHLDPAYNSATTAGGGVLSNTSYRPIDACTRDSSGPGTSDGDTLTLTERATIRGGTPAGSDYSDVITVVGAGNF